MKYCIYHSSHPIIFASCGNLISENGFIHPRRNIDSFVLLLVQKGTLYISQGKDEYAIHENEFLILFPDTLHYGTKSSSGYLSYYWTHFYLSDSSYQITDTFHYEDNFLPAQDILQVLKGHVVLPETGSVSSAGHSHLLFLQLMDIACREHYKPTYKCHYALCLLLLEFSSESLSAFLVQDMDIPPRMTRCINWIQLHYNQPLSASEIADRFGYNPAYLTGLFKKYTGYSLIHYINHVRISAAKNLLTNQELTIDSIAQQCGFADCKYFYRLFKKTEHVTPTEYRNAFHHKKLVL